MNQASAAVYETHAAVRRLTDAGIPEPHAEAVAQGQTHLIERNLATKVDMEVLRQGGHRSLSSQRRGCASADQGGPPGREERHHPVGRRPEHGHDRPDGRRRQAPLASRRRPRFSRSRSVRLACQSHAPVRGRLTLLSETGRGWVRLPRSPQGRQAMSHSSIFTLCSSLGVSTAAKNHSGTAPRSQRATARACQARSMRNAGSMSTLRSTDAVNGRRAPPLEIPAGMPRAPVPDRDWRLPIPSRCGGAPLLK